MAIYHLTAKIISRADGRSIVRAAAYRSASVLFDQRAGLQYSYAAKAGVIHAEMLLPPGAPAWMADRERLWNHVEMTEKRIDAQLAREVEFALPRELSREDNIALARAFVQREFVDEGMVADLCIYWDFDSSGNPKPHAHVLLTLRGIQGDGFGLKRRQWRMAPDGKTYLLDAAGERIPDWNNKQTLLRWRERWAEYVNQRLAERGIDQQIDHRSHADRGIRIEPEKKIHGMTSRLLEEGLVELTLERDADQLGPHAARAVKAVARHSRNIERLYEDPSILLEVLTATQSTFSEADLRRALHRYTALAITNDEYQALYVKVRHHHELLAVGKDRSGVARFSTRAMIETEEQMERLGGILKDKRTHALAPPQPSTSEHLGEDQRIALRHVLTGPDISSIVGMAGSGKTTLLAALRHEYEREGFRVKGAALAGIAAENLHQGAGIESRTLASLFNQWKTGRAPLTDRDVLIVDEAGMIGSRDMNALLHAVEHAKAKIVLVGDAQQLQAISAGAAFRALVEQTGAATLSTVRRQSQEWRRDATAKLGRGDIPAALSALRDAGAISDHATTSDAKAALIKEWAALAESGQSTVLLAHRREDVSDLNTRARTALREKGLLGAEQQVELVRRTRGDDGAEELQRTKQSFAIGERVLFTRNERSLGVNNGTLGTLLRLEKGQFEVRLDTGDIVRFDAHTYGDLELGYALTIHKAQGATVNHAFVLASNTFDQHLAYVALSHDRHGVRMAYGRDQFDSPEVLDAKLGRERAKDTTLDYRDEPALGLNVAPTSIRITPLKEAQRAAPAQPVPIPAHLAKGPSPALKPPVRVKLPPPSMAPRPPTRPQSLPEPGPNADEAREAAFAAWQKAREEARQRNLAKKRAPERDR